MSISPLTDTDALQGELPRPNVSRLVVRPLKRLAFWSAIVLPFLHVSLLVSGLESQSMVLAFVALLALNAVAIYVGHPHARD